MTTPSTIAIRALSVSLDRATLQLPDGSRWSHAATFGSFLYRGETVTLDEDTMSSFVDTLAAGGYPQKVPVDYDHGSIDKDPSGTSPKAGDVLELRVVRSAPDLPPTAAEQIARAGRTLTDPLNLGLWMRWLPTPVAETRIQNREYTELSIAWLETLTNPRTGEKQGPTLLSVALLNTPHLDTMVPIAAARDVGGSPTDSGQQRSDMDKPTLLARLGVLLGRVVSTEEEASAEAETQIKALRTEVQTLQPAKAFASAIGAELGETDTTKAVAKVRELKAEVVKSEAAAKEAKTVALGAKVTELLKKFEDRYVPANREYFATQLRADLEAGRDTTEKALAAMPVLDITKRASGADEGQSGASDKDAQISLRSEQLLKEDAGLVALAKTDPNGAMRQAITRAAREVSASTK